MGNTADRQLDNRLSTYGTTVRTLKRSTEKWPVYAAVTGAAMAMASNASASVIYSGIVDITAAAPAPGASQLETMSANVQLKSASGGLISRSFLLRNFREQGGTFQIGTALFQAPSVGFLMHSYRVKRLSSGAVISGAGNARTYSGANGFVPGRNIIADRGGFKDDGGASFDDGWTQSKGFAAFSFHPVAGGTDYGWVRLQFTVGQSNTIQSVTAIDWAYQNNGSAIVAGDTGVSGAPEPSTAALTLLTIGAAGVETLRKRRKAACPEN